MWLHFLVMETLYHHTCHADTLISFSARNQLWDSFLYLKFIFILLFLQFYARGLFARAPITWAGGPYTGMAGRLRKITLGSATLILSLCDQPLRSISRGSIYPIHSDI